MTMMMTGKHKTHELFPLTSNQLICLLKYIIFLMESAFECSNSL